jgi:large subunit ribosomal protein L25
MQAKVIPIEPRSTIGKRANQRLREDGRVPGIIYGHGIEPQPVSLPRHELEYELSRGGHILHVALKGKEEQFLIKDVQYDYLGIAPIHVDLARVDLTERVEVHVPLEFRGTAAGVKAGGVLDSPMMTLEVECQLNQIPDKIIVKVDQLEIGQAIHLSQLELPQGVKAIGHPEAVVCVVHMLAEQVAGAAAPAEGESAEPEIIGRGKEADEEAAE